MEIIEVMEIIEIFEIIEICEILIVPLLFAFTESLLRILISLLLFALHCECLSNELDFGADIVCLLNELDFRADVVKQRTHMKSPFTVILSLKCFGVATSPRSNQLLPIVIS